MPPVSHGNTPLSMAPNLVRHPLKPSVVRGTRMRRWSTFTPPRHAAGAARCGLFLLRRSYLGEKTFRLVVLGDNGKVLLKKKASQRQLTTFSAIHSSCERSVFTSSGVMLVRASAAKSQLH